MAHLSLYLLGTFQAALDGEPVTGFESAKARALLAYLAVEADRPHRRESLAGLLWPNRPGKTARGNLRHTLAALRTTIGDRDAAPPFLSITRETIQFNHASDCWLDVEAFRALVEADQGGRSTTRQMQEAVALYRGGFLEGFSVGDSRAFEDWSLLTRERLRRQVSAVLRRLIRQYEGRGEFERACEHAWRRVELEPWQEEAHQRLMRLLALSGQRSAALAQYGACCRALAVELDVEPTEETTRLYEQILDGELAAPEDETQGLKPHRLPVPLTPLIGRETELAEIAGRLQEPSCRLLTLVGPGGSGKTHLALEAARAWLSRGQDGRFPDGIYFVPLAPLQSVEAIVPAVAQAIGLSFDDGGRPEQQLFDYLRRKRMLLILDNLEHLLADPANGEGPATGERSEPGREESRCWTGADIVLDLLRAAQNVGIVATSRTRLNVQSEHLYAVGGMDCPSADSPADESASYGLPRDTPNATGVTDVSQYSAVRLFLSAARRVRTGFEPAADALAHVARICGLVEGLPLAILHAAAWMDVLTPAEIAAEIAADLGAEIEGQMAGLGLDVLEGRLHDLPERQRSMRAVFDHSWRLLSLREREVLAGLSVFRGGCTRRAAAQVTGATLREFGALVDRSLLHRASAGRYEMHELLRQYAAGKLEQMPDVARSVHDEFSAYYVTAAQGWGRDLKGPSQRTALAEMDLEVENARAACTWAARQRPSGSLDGTVEGLCRYYEMRGRYREGEAWCRAVETALAAPGSRELRTLANVLVWRGIFGFMLGHKETLQLFQQSLDLLQRPELVDQDTRREEAFARLHMGQALEGSDLERAERMCRTSLALYEAVGDRWGAANALDALGGIVRHTDSYDKARQYHEASLSIRRSLADRMGIADSLMELAHIALGDERNFGQGERLMRESLTIRREIGGEADIARGLQYLGLALNYQGKFAQACSALQESAGISDELGSLHRTAALNTIWASAEMHLGQYRQARIRGQASLTFAQEHGNRRLAIYCLQVLGDVALAEQAYIKAQQLARKTFELCLKIGEQDSLSWSLITAAYASLGLGQVSEAKETMCKVLQNAVKLRASLSTIASLPLGALLLVHLDRPEWATALYALASRYPYVANSRWSSDVSGQHIAAAATALPPDAIASTQERGRARDLRATVKELLAECCGEQ